MVRINRTLLEEKRDARAAEALRSELAAARARWEQNESLLYARAGIRRAPKVADPLQSPAALIPAAGDVILDFVVGEKQTTLFVLSRDGEEVRASKHMASLRARRGCSETSNGFSVVWPVSISITKAMRELYTAF